jgi:hypothetical protein
MTLRPTQKQENLTSGLTAPWIAKDPIPSPSIIDYLDFPVRQSFYSEVFVT